MTTTEPRRRPRVHLDDVDHLRAYGIPDHEIAARLGVRTDSISRSDQRRRRRADPKAS